MTDNTSVKPPVSFWIVGALALLWNLLGVMAYIGQVTMSDEAIASMPAEQQAALAALPSWYMGVFAAAVFGGALGSLALLLAKRWAIPLLGISLVAVAVQQAYFWVLTDIAIKQHGGQMAMTIAIPVVALLLFWLARSSAAKGWLR